MPVPHAVPSQDVQAGERQLSFIHGAPVAHAEGLVYFSDAVWFMDDLVPPNRKRSAGRISFSAHPLWMRDAVKRHVAWKWLGLKAPLSTVQGARGHLLHLSAALPGYNGTLLALGRHEARAVTAYMRQMLDSGALT